MYVVYSKENCPFCDKAKALFDEAWISYVVVDLVENPDKLKELKEMGCRTVPQIFMTDDDDPRTRLHIGGYEDLVKFLQN